MVTIGLAAFAALWIYSLLSKKTPAQKLAALREEVKPKGGQVFETTLLDKPVAFLLEGCNLYILDPNGEDEVKRQKVLSPGFYFWLDTCTEQSIRKEGEFVLVYLANRAIGAGGGNTSGGHYRSRNGYDWEKNTETGWLPLNQAQQ